MEVRGQRKEEKTESINYVGRADGVEYIVGVFFNFYSSLIYTISLTQTISTRM
jgi:hypothetical protein